MSVVGITGVAADDPWSEDGGTARMIAVHNAAMECFRRAMVPEQHFEARRVNLNQANKLSRACADLVAVLDKRRVQGQQRKATVEHVHVHGGGQAIVGAIATGGGDDKP